MTPRHLIRKRVIGLVIALAATAFALTVAAGVGSSSGVCESCHRAVVVATEKSAHAAVPCSDCHAPGAEAVGFRADVILRMYPSKLLGGEPSGAVRETSRKACLTCHGSVLSAVTQAGPRGLRINHAACATEATCDSCHSATAHGAEVRWVRGPVMEDCIACHREQAVTTECTVCHEGRNETERLATGPWQVTHGPKWRQTHGMGDLDSCVTCHPKDYCVRCHKVSVPHDERFGAQHGGIASADVKSCQGCHRSKRFCDACHGVPMPHPGGFLRRHSKDAKTVTNPACQRCHAVEDCRRCHERHIHPGNARASSGLQPPVPGGGDAR